MKKFLFTATLLCLFLCLQAQAQTRTRWIGAPGDQGYLQFYDLTSGVNIITFDSSGVTVSGGVFNAGTTNWAISGNLVVSGTSTSGQFATTGGLTAASATVPTINGGVIAATNKLTVPTIAISGGSTNAGPFVSGGLSTTGALSVGSMTFTGAATAAPTNAIRAGFLLPINGTNYWVPAYLPNT